MILDETLALISKEESEQVKNQKRKEAKDALQG